MQSLRWHSMIFIFAFLVPCTIWYQQSGNLSVYFSAGVPEGQLLYVLSKLTGMLALFCIAWQMIMTILGRLKPLSMQWPASVHRVFGGVTLVLTLTHVVLFFSAVSLRQDDPAWGLLVPDFGDYYHTHLTMGLIGLFVLVAVAVAGLLRVLKQNQWAKHVHRLYWLSLSLVYLHALTVGSESQSSAGLVLYITLGMMVLLLWSWYGFKQVISKAAIS